MIGYCDKFNETDTVGGFGLALHQFLSICQKKKKKNCKRISLNSSNTVLWCDTALHYFVIYVILSIAEHLTLVPV